MPVTRCQSSGPLGALLSSPALDVRLLTALQVLQAQRPSQLGSHSPRVAALRTGGCNTWCGASGAAPGPHSPIEGERSTHYSLEVSRSVEFFVFMVTTTNRSLDHGEKKNPIDWHGVRANIDQGLCWPASRPFGLTPRPAMKSSRVCWRPGPSGFSRNKYTHHGWPSREQDVPFRFGAAQNLPHGTPGRYPAKPHDPEKRISRPGAASDSGRIGHFAGAAYAFLAKMVKMSSQSCRRRVRHPIRPNTEGGGAARRWQGTASANVRLL